MVVDVVVDVVVGGGRGQEFNLCMLELQRMRVTALVRHHSCWGVAAGTSGSF